MRTDCVLDAPEQTRFLEDAERGLDESLKLQIEPMSHLDPCKRKAVQSMIAGVLHMHEAKRRRLSRNAPTEAREPASARAVANRTKATRG